jgi:hypothetical protein
MSHAALARRGFALAWIGSMAALGSAVAAPSAGIADEARLVPPASGRIRVAFVLSPHATMIDFAGPWEVFQDARVPGRGPGDEFPFELFTVAETREPLEVTGGMRIVPRYAFADAPEAQVIVVPAQAGSPGLRDWLRKASAGADLTMSVCTGAFLSRRRACSTAARPRPTMTSTVSSRARTPRSTSSAGRAGSRAAASRPPEV